MLLWYWVNWPYGIVIQINGSYFKELGENRALFITIAERYTVFNILAYIHLQ